eukprot:6045314-Alexandrium_andersonii.AAC.1
MAPPGADGTRHPVRSAAVALPAVAMSPEAEAWGRRLALEFALAAGPSAERSLAVVGGTLGVARYAAAAGRLRRAPLHAVLEGTLGGAAVRGLDIQ